MADIVKRELDQILPLKQRKELLSLIGRGEGEDARELSLMTGIDESIIVELMNDDEFYLEVCNHTQADLRLTHHTMGKKTLKHILQYGENKESPGRLKAYDRLARMVGADQPPAPPNINIFNLEAELSQSVEKNVTPARSYEVGREKEDPRPGRDEVSVEFKHSLKPRKDRGRMDNIPSLEVDLEEEEEVNGNIFEAMEEEREIDDQYEHLFRNSRELDLTD